MIFFVISRNGFESYLPFATFPLVRLWISAGILTASELKDLRDRGADVTDFSYEIDLNEVDVIDDAIETIKEHHPDQVIWVER